MNEILNSIDQYHVLLFVLLFTACFVLNEYKMKADELGKRIYWITHKKEKIK